MKKWASKVAHNRPKLLFSQSSPAYSQQPGIDFSYYKMPGTSICSLICDLYVHRLATVFRNHIIFPSFFPIPLLAYCYILKKSPVLSELLIFKSIKGTYCPGRGFKQLESIVCWSNFMFAHTWSRHFNGEKTFNFFLRLVSKSSGYFGALLFD